MASITCHSQIGIQMGIHHTFSQTRLLPLLIPSSSLRRTLPFTLKIRVSPCFIERRRRLSDSTWVEMLTVYVQNVNHQGNDAKGLSSTYSLSKWSPLNPFSWIGSRLSESHLNH